MKRIMLLFVACAMISQAAYIATPCNPCAIQSGSRAATEAELAPLTNQLFSNWAKVDSPFVLSSVKTNNWGYVAGQYSTQGITSSFIYNAGLGALICCTFDTLFRVMDLNNNNLVVGYGNSGAFIGRLGGFNIQPLDLMFDKGFNLNGFGLTSNSMFVAIDDRDSILLFQDGQSYALTHAPEPTTIGLLFLGMVAMWIKFPRRK